MLLFKTLFAFRTDVNIRPAIWQFLLVSIFSTARAKMNKPNFRNQAIGTQICTYVNEVEYDRLIRLEGLKR